MVVSKLVEKKKRVAQRRGMAGIKLEDYDWSCDGSEYRNFAAACHRKKVEICLYRTVTAFCIINDHGRQMEAAEWISNRIK